MVVTKAWELGGKESIVYEYRILDLHNENILEICLPSMWTYLTLLNCTFKNFHLNHFSYVFFTAIQEMKKYYYNVKFEDFIFWELVWIRTKTN